MKKETKKELLYKARIKELENLLCPAEQHDYILVETRPRYEINGVTYIDRYVCKRCFKARNVFRA